MQASFEKVSTGADASFRCFERTDPAFGFNWHYHAECELTLILTGRGRRFVGDDIASYTAGDLILIGPELPHTWVSDPDSGPQRAIVIQFTPGFWGRAFEALPEMASVGRLLERSARGLSFSESPEGAGVAKRMQAMAHESPAQRLLILLEVLHVLSQVARPHMLASPGFAPRLRRGEQQRIDRACAYLHEHFADAVRQADVAKRVRMNPAAFSRFFHRATGRTMTAYLHELRVAEACRLLVEADLSILEICFRAGFGNLSNFNRQFRRIKGMSPGAYRRGFLAPSA